MSSYFLKDNQLIIRKINRISQPILKQIEELLYQNKILNTIKEIDELTQILYNFTGSKIINCKINNKEQHTRNYRPLLIYLYTLIGDRRRIIRKSELAKKDKLRIDNVGPNTGSFVELDDIELYIKRALLINDLIREIVIQCYSNNINLLLEIEMNDKRLVFVNI